MPNKSILLLIFLLVAFLQLLVPANMIFQKNKTVVTGTLYKFKVKPVDPADPFVGRYVDLSFDQDTFVIKDSKFYADQQTIYVEIAQGIDSFAIIKNISLSPFKDTEHFITAKVAYIQENRVHIEYPFTRFYMEESKAPEAETKVNIMLRDSTYLGYAEIFVYKGDAVVQDVKINNRTIKSL
jgi:uncharacterized membrane-anchored protein